MMDRDDHDILWRTRGSDSGAAQALLETLSLSVLEPHSGGQGPVSILIAEGP